ncbi:putative Tetratricopeptide repeat protein [Naja naja]|nr:putative Tetratricopeptide repeat protein [Naja naja]
MESEDAVAPEKLIEDLNLSEKQSSPTHHAYIPRVVKEGVSQLSDLGREEDDLFHDCKDSVESRVVEENHNTETDPLENEMDLDEKELLELEKNMSEEEKEKRRNESTTLKEEGNKQFKNGEYKEAEDSYAKALQDKKEMAISDCSKALELNPNYIKALLRRAELYEKTEKLDEALEDYKNLLEKDPSVYQAREACMRLPKEIEERNEKLKAEMLGKLKDLGNLVLRPFGLSTENFQVKQDSSTGSYSINFVQNPNNNNR